MNLSSDALPAYLPQAEEKSDTVSMKGVELEEFIKARDAAASQGRTLGPIEWRNGAR